MTRARRHATLLAAVFMLGACRQHAGSELVASGSDAQRAVLTGLRHPVEIAGQPPLRMRLVDRMAYYAVPAVSIAVVQHNRIVWAGAYGVRRAGGSDSVTTATLMQAASISKPLTALAVLRLAQRGTLALDDSANARLTSWRIPANAFTAKTPVRIAHLLSHSAGATNGAVGIYAPGVATPTLLQALGGVAPSNRPAVRIDFEPGTRYRYAGGGYSILQQLLIDVTGQPFPDLMQELVLSPVEMRSSCFCQPLPDRLAPRAASGHDRAGKPLAGEWWTLPEMAAGGVWTTAEDLAQFAIAMNAAWNGSAKSVLSKSLARQMLTPGHGGYGLGFVVDTVEGELRYSHTGSNNGYRAVLIGYPARGSAIAILTNGDGGGDLRAGIVRATAATYGWPGDKSTQRAVDAIANPVLADFAGAFRYSPGFTSTFTVRDGALTAQLNDGTPVRIYSERPDTFFSLEGTTYRFVRDRARAVVSVNAVFSDGTDLPATRVVR